MGLWGAAQAVAFGLGGFAGTLVVVVARRLVATPLTAYDLAFVAEAMLFVLSAVLAGQIAVKRTEPARAEPVVGETPLAARI